MHDVSNLKPWLLRAKVSPPRRRVETLSRAALLDRLQSTARGGLAVVRAPAGYGKSLLLAEWRERLLQQDIGCAWLGLDEDDDLESVLAHLAFAFHLGGLDMSATGLLQLGAEGERSPARVLRILLQIIEASLGRFVLILDDLERLDAAVAQWFLSSVLRNNPENLTLVFASRQRPPVDLSDFALRGMLTEINSEDLKFNRDEIAAILGADEHTDIDGIEQRTEGWPAFVQLLSAGQGALSWQHHATGQDNFTHYLRANILAQISESQRLFLLEASVFSDIPAAFFKKRYGGENFHRLFHESNLLQELISPLDGDTDFWRIHPLLRTYLRSQLHEEMPQQATGLRRDAARWLSGQGQVLEALRQATAIADAVLVEEILFTAGGPVTIWLQGLGYLQRINDMVSRIAVSANANRQHLPLTILLNVIAQTKAGFAEAARQCFEDAEANGQFSIAKDHPQANQDLKKLVEFSAAITRATLDVHNFTPLQPGVMDTLKTYQQTWFASAPRLQGIIHNVDALLSNEQSQFAHAITSGQIAISKFRIDSSSFGEAHANLHIAAANLALGRAEETAVVLKRSRQVIRRDLPDDEQLQVMLECMCGELDLETLPKGLSDIEQFQARFLAGIEKLSVCLDFLFAGLLQIIDVQWLRHKNAAAHQFLNDCDAITRGRNACHVVRYIQQLRILLLAREDQIGDAQPLFDRLAPTGETSSIWREMETRAEVISLLATTGTDNNINLVERQMQFAEQTGNKHTLLRLLAVECCRLAQAGRQAEAFRQLQQLAQLSGDCGYFRAIAVNAQSILPLIQEYNDTHAQKLTYTDSILAKIGGPAHKNSGLAQEPLHFTSAELRVLSALELGQSNKMIARVLAVSPNTVHFHLKNIYRKLGASSRHKAAKLARQMNIV